MRFNYLWLWPFRDYHDADAGSALERAAAFRHNKRLAKALPTYLNRWSAIDCVLLTASVACPTRMAPLLGTAFTLAFCMTALIALVYVLFSRS